LFSGLSILLSSASYARGTFLRPALAQALNSSIVLSVVAAFTRSLGIRSIAVGAFVGSLVQLAILAPVLFRRGRYRPSLAVRMPEVARLGGLMLPLLLGALFYRTNPLVERFFASKLGEGRIAYLGYAFRLISAFCRPAKASTALCRGCPGPPPWRHGS
jgi:peptidoglycan biosynthesis protein MviN/MurJ (putative lipid II flippase)